jgi:hypothetical protein
MSAFEVRRVDAEPRPRNNLPLRMQDTASKSGAKP